VSTYSLAFATYNGALLTEVMRITGNTGAGTTGNVGIGTTTPVANLHVGVGAPSMALTTALGVNDA